MDRKRLSWRKKYWLKYTDKPGYFIYKKQYGITKEERKFIEGVGNIIHPPLEKSVKDIVSFKHNGHAGDVIYAIPAMLALAGKGKIKLYLHENQPVSLFEYHPSGNVGLTKKTIDYLKELLSLQPAIESVHFYNGEPIDYDLDHFRTYNFLTDRGSITRWYFHVYGVCYDTSLPWLQMPKDPFYQDKIVIARSHRYRQPLIDYGFLQHYPNKLFVGLPEEYADMKKAIPDLQYKSIKNFVELATIINSCKLFIGNQSFPFSLAEALKANRLLEVNFRVPNVIPEGKGANDFLYQPQFEYSVKRLLEEN